LTRTGPGEYPGNVKKARVAIVRCPDYDPGRVREAVAEAVSLIGGAENLTRPGETVLVKPNLLSARPPEDAVTTHPAVVQAAIDLFTGAGAHVLLGDSPPLAGERQGSYRRLLEITGMSGAAEQSGAKIVRFEEASVTVRQPQGRCYRTFEIARAVAQADALISVSKLKTHGLTFLTAAVKNVFGCIPGRRKALFHAQAAEDPEIFSQMLVDLLGAVRPRLSILDAIVAMDSDGPVDGRLRNLGLILAGTDPVALDAVASAVLGVDPLAVDTTRLAAAQGLGVADLEAVEVVGERLEDVAWDGFLEPQSKNRWTQIPKPLRSMLKNQLIPFPCVTSACQNCGACVTGCPVRTIQPGRERPRIVLGGCIRCYCCREVCEYSAIGLRVRRLSASLRLIRDARRAVLRFAGRR